METEATDWVRITEHAAWAPRWFDSNSIGPRDVWSSADGVHWELATSSAPWTARAYHAAVVVHDKIWVFGGGNYLSSYHGCNDVWNSSDGAHWDRATDRAP